MSDPVPGSVIASAQTSSPAMIRGRYRRFWASVPKRVNHGEDMSVCTRTLKATPPERHRAISSPRTTLERKSPPPPPCSVGNSRPRKPSSPRRRQSERGIRPASSHSRTCGVTSFSTKARMLLRSISCSSEKMRRPTAQPFAALARSSCRSSVRRILPEMVFGRSRTNSISRGYL